MTTYRIIFTSDLHGSTLVFRKFLRALLMYEAHLGIIGGDITGKMLVPIIEKGGAYETILLGNVRRASNQDELKKMIIDIENSGFYHEIMSEDVYEEFRNNKVKLDELFKTKILERIANWVREAEDFVERYKKANIYMMPGNDDIKEIDEVISKSNHIINPNEKVIEITSDHEMVASAYSNITPWRCPRDLTEEELESRLEKIMSKVRNFNNLIFVSHVPPFNTKIDLAPKLTEDLKFEIKGGVIMMEHVGSSAVRKIIEKYQPLIGLHGHIHESRGFDKIGRTIVFNPGSEYGEGIFHGVLVTIEKDRIKGYMLLTG